MKRETDLLDFQAMCPYALVSVASTEVAFVAHFTDDDGPVVRHCVSVTHQKGEIGTSYCEDEGVEFTKYFDTSTMAEHFMDCLTAEQADDEVFLVQCGFERT